MRTPRPSRPAALLAAGLALAPAATVALSASAATVALSASAATVAALGGTTRTNGVAVSGALFPRGPGRPHTCTGTVTTIGGDSVVVTAAHCITGTARGWLFVPGYHDGVAPYGVYSVQGVYVHPRWGGGRDWRYDVAVLRVAKIRRTGGYRNIGAVTGTTVLRTTPPPAGTVVDITGYPNGLRDKPLSCANRYSVRNGWGYTSCDRLPSGVSGSGLRHGSDGRGHQYLAGSIGGLHGGGCYVHEAYTPTYGPWVATLVRRARDNRPADTLPTQEAWDGCHGTRP